MISIPTPHPLYTFLGRHSFSEGGYTAKPPTNHYAPPTNHYAPSTSHYAPSTKHYAPSTKHYAPSTNDLTSI